MTIKRHQRRLFRSILGAAALATASLSAQTYQTAFDQARDLLKQKQYAQALEAARQGIHFDSSHWEAWYVAGTAAVGLQKFDLAVDYFQEALTRAPEQSKPTINQAIAACHQIVSSEAPPPPAPNYPIPTSRLEARLPSNVPPVPASNINTVHVYVESFVSGEICPGTLQFAAGMVTYKLDKDDPKCLTHEFSVARKQVKSFGYNHLKGLGIGEFHLNIQGLGTREFVADGNDYAVKAFFATLGHK